MQTRKSSFSLLEILIALPLMSLLMFTTIKTYTSLNALSLGHKKAAHKLKENQYFRERIKKMFSSLPSDQIKLKSNKNALEFHYDNGVNRAPFASNNVMAQLFLKQEQLTLKVYKLDEKKKKTLIRKEVFFNDIIKAEYLWGYIEEGVIQYFKEPKDNPALALKLNLTRKYNSKPKSETYIFEL